MAEKKVYIGTGRRKTSVAKVRMTAGKGKITINGKDVNEYLPFPTLIMDLMQPLEVTGMKDKFDIVVDAYGG
ncbi:MAG: 30S ribosomal protein S9, partial [Bacilli bacterium]|nr:30S ribosomal protein S9 [Bacilli bacterium]